MKPLPVIKNKIFRSVKFQRATLTETLPLLPAPLNYEPWMEGRPRGHVTVVLTREKEKERFLQYNFWKHVYNQAMKREGDLGGVLLRAAMHMREYLTRLNMPLVYSMVARSRGKFDAIDWDEAVSEAQTALMRAIDGFDVSVGVKFSTYAVRAILRSLRSKCIKKQKQESRVAYTDLSDVYNGSQEIVASERGGSDDLDALKHVLDNNLANLSPVESAVMAMRFGLGDKEDLTLEQIAQNVGVSKERIRQIQNKALEKMRAAMERVS